MEKWSLKIIQRLWNAMIVIEMLKPVMQISLMLGQPPSVITTVDWQS